MEDEDLKLHDVEKMKKCIKGKRCAMDQEFSLVKEMTKAIIDVDAKIAAAKKWRLKLQNWKNVVSRLSSESCLLDKIIYSCLFFMLYVIFVETHLYVLMIQALTMVFSTAHTSLKISYTIVITLSLINKKNLMVKYYFYLIYR